jgi:hypothetical protein
VPTLQSCMKIRGKPIGTVVFWNTIIYAGNV